MEIDLLSNRQGFLNQIVRERKDLGWIGYVVMDGSILIVDDVATNRIVLRAKLLSARYRPLLAATGAEALRISRTERPDLIILDLYLPDIPGIEVLKALREDPATSQIPVIVLSSATRAEDRTAALAAGADEVFRKPCDDGLLLARLRNLLRGRQEMTALVEEGSDSLTGLAEAATPFSGPGNLAIVTGRKEVGLRLRRDLSPLIRDNISLLSLDEALGDFRQEPAHPDLYVIDAVGEPTERTRRLLSDLRSRAGTRHAGICLVTRAPDHGSAAIAFDLGANDVVSDDTPADEIAVRIRAILRRKRQADRQRESVQDGLRLAIIDPVTGLYNRRFALANLSRLIAARAPGARPLSVLLADLDRFKSVNDRFGHSAGDQVLVEVGRRLGTNLRPEDLLSRFGGEEFLILLPDTGLPEAQIIADRLCAILADRPIDLPSGVAVPVTASFGLAVLCDDSPRLGMSRETRLRDLIDEADRALLAAKASGRNTVTVARRDVA